MGATGGQEQQAMDKAKHKYLAVAFLIGADKQRFQ